MEAGYIQNYQNSEKGDSSVYELQVPHGREEEFELFVQQGKGEIQASDEDLWATGKARII